MKVVFALHYSHLEDRFGLTDGGTRYGHRLMEPAVRLRARLESQGFEVLTRREWPVEQADMAVFGDLDEELWRIALSLPREIPCILTCMESPIYTPMSHEALRLFSKRWAAVLTWNRSFQAEHIHYYDIPIAAATPAELAAWRAAYSSDSTGKGVAVSSYKHDVRGLTWRRDRLFVELAKRGHIDLYGTGWPTDNARGLYGGCTSDKLATMRPYCYSLLCENVIYPGYVTEKLGDSVLAGLPAIYYGDFETAERRFPGTFVRLNGLSVTAFLQAREALLADYDALRSAVERSLQDSPRWSDSFVDTVSRVVESVARGETPVRNRGAG